MPASDTFSVRYAMYLFISPSVPNYLQDVLYRELEKHFETLLCRYHCVSERGANTIINSTTHICCVNEKRDARQSRIGSVARLGIRVSSTLTNNQKYEATHELRAILAKHLGSRFLCDAFINSP